MKTKLIGLLSLLAPFAIVAPSAAARSLDPCTPTVQAQDTRISCSARQMDGSTLHYFILVDTLMSPNLSICQGDKHVEYKTAKVSVRDEADRPVANFEVGNGDFSYTLSPIGDSTFKSRNPKLDLQNCVSPLNGGFSVSN